MKTENTPSAGETNCLGWCGKKFWSTDKTKIRFCTKCRAKRDAASSTMSRIEMRSIGGYAGGVEPPASKKE